ncbi:MAG TPA: proton-conducting transporter membrane subunit [Candidatus Methylomirabilis sp.]|nr:proton-conducting transporter membrane subunit [Candidatus Methylomirabilis sp.]
MNALILPILVPFLTALILALLNGQYRLEKALALFSSLSLTIWVFWLLVYVDGHGVQVVIIGGWKAPWGIAFVADRLTTIMLCLSTGLGTLVQLYSFWTVTEQQQRYFFYPLMQAVLLGVNWSFITGDVFNLFVAYEVMLMASYGVMMVGASPAQVRQTLKYITINCLGSTLFVVGCGVLYATVGTLNMADLAVRTAALTGPRAGMVTAASMLLLLVFALKAATFPLIYWLPESYPVVPLGVNGYFAGILTKVGVYSLLRVFILSFRQEGHQFALDVLLFLSGFTMLLGVLGAMCRWDIRRILSWHIISQVGYMVMGIGLAGSPDPRVAELAVAGTIFYVVHHIVVKSCLFLVGGIAERVSGSQHLKQMGGIVTLAPGVAGLFIVAGLSLAGMPPFSGFLSKVVLAQAGLASGHYVVVAVAVITSFFTLYSMSKIWSYAFWREPRPEPAPLAYRGMMAPTAVLVAFTIAMGLFAQPFLGLAARAAETLTKPAEYIRTVLDAEQSRRVAVARPDAPVLARLEEGR